MKNIDRICCHKGNVVFMIVWSLILILLCACTVGVRPPECKLSVNNAGFEEANEESFKAVCHLRTLTAAYFNSRNINSSLSILNDAFKITSLYIKCAHQVVFQSEVSKAMFSHFRRLEELSIVFCKLISVPEHFLSGLSNLRKLTIKSHHEDWPGADLEISEYVLYDLPRLEVLNLSNNNLWKLPPGSLCLLPSLTTFNVTYNSLHDLNEFELNRDSHCSHPILHLYLDHNQISEVNDRALEGASNLRVLTLSNNGLSHFADSAFKGLNELRRLDISHNNLVALPKRLFTHLKQLRDLNIANNLLTSLPPRAFKSLSHLLTLDLKHNHLDLSTNQEENFKGLIRLVILNLSNNKINYIAPKSFKDLYSLQVLYLNYNSISYLDDNSFSSLANLHTLNLSNNELTILTSNVFSGLSVLTFLTLTENKLSNIHSTAFKNCSSLQQIDMSKNNFTIVPSALKLIPLLQILNLNYNKINYLHPFLFEGMDYLQNLHLAHNSISNVTNDAFHGLGNLKLLDVSNNNISNIQNGSLFSIKELQGFNMSHNKLNGLLGVISVLEKLAWFNVSHNSLQWFDYAVLPLNLKWIDLSYNEIDKLGNHFKLHDKIKLRYVYASNNNITELNAESIPNKIKEIYLQNNSIDYVASNTLKDKVSLSVIDLSNNFLAMIADTAIRLPARSQDSHSYRPLLYLSGNILNCDCSAEWLIKSIRDNSLHYPSGISILPRLGDVTNIKCKLPGIWHDSIVPVITVEAHQFLCSYRRHCFPVCHCCEFDACDCEQTCPRNCTCYHDHTWTHNIVDCGDGEWSIMPSGVPMDVTEAYMDGNNIGALTSHSLIGRKNLRILYLNSSKITVIQNKTFNGLKRLKILKLSDNLIEKLNGYEFNMLKNLVELHLDNNLITYLGNHSFAHLKFLEILKIDRNRITFFPVWNLALNNFLVKVSLHKNPWSCECTFLAKMRAWLETNRIKTVDGVLVNCLHKISNKTGPPILSDSRIRCEHFLASNNFNSILADDYVMLLTIGTSILLLLLFGAFIVIVYRRRLKFWAAKRYGKRFYSDCSSNFEDSTKLFDAYICHSAKDSMWVCGLLAPELEAQGYHLCVAHRDCAQSSPISSQAITESISCSKRVIMVLSKGFIDTEWCKYEFKSAHVEALRNFKRKRLIIIILENLPKSEYDTELNAIVRSTNSPLIPTDHRFWERLKRSLPNVRRNNLNRKDFNKAVSAPLVSVQDLALDPNAWHLSEIKSIPQESSPHKNISVNPYWETAISNNIPNGSWIQPGSSSSSATNPTWISPMQRRPIVSSQELDKKFDHTYMCMSELGDKILEPSEDNEINSEEINGLSNFKTLPINSVKQDERFFVNGSLNNFQNIQNGTPILKKKCPDYLTRSWIFHHTQDQPNPGQTYFV